MHNYVIVLNQAQAGYTQTDHTYANQVIVRHGGRQSRAKQGDA
jgi:hypothetical protein